MMFSIGDTVSESYGGMENRGSQTNGSVFLNNTQPVYAIQFDILFEPPFINGAESEFQKEILDLDGWSYSGTDLKWL